MMSGGTSETKEKGLGFQKGYTPWNKGGTSWNKGIPCREETKKKIGLANKGNISYWKGKRKSTEAQIKLSIPQKGRHYSPKTEFKKGHKRGMTGKHHSKETLKKILSSSKPTKPEIKLNKLLQEHFPNEFKYVGDGEVVFGGKNPDFINCNGKKLIIEMFGRIYHDPKLKPKSMRKVKWHEQEIGTKMHYSQYGYKTLVIWDNEIKNVEDTINKIGEFIR